MVIDLEGKKVLVDVDVTKMIYNRFDKLVSSFKIADSKSNTKYKENLLQFSLFKNHKEVGEITSLMLDKDGKLRDFKSFKADALNISSNYNQNWLATEYNTAKRSLENAKFFEKVYKEKDDYPLLKWVTKNDSRVRETHQELEGVILPYNHVFWRTNAVPRSFNCRCEIKQLKKGTITKNIPNSEIANDEFSFNSFFSDQVFDLNYGYAKDLTESERRLVLEYMDAVKK